MVPAARAPVPRIAGAANVAATMLRRLRCRLVMDGSSGNFPAISPGTVQEPSMIDHVTIAVGDVERSKSFADRAFRPLGIERLYAEGSRFGGYGIRPKAFFWIGERIVSQTSVNMAFAGCDRATVDDFYAAALAAGGHDNG